MWLSYAQKKKHEWVHLRGIKGDFEFITLIEDANVILIDGSHASILAFPIKL